jgi:hypothetical protein
MTDKQSSVERIASALEGARIAVVSTHRCEHINSRCMLFATDATLEHFFFITNSETDKLKELRVNADATACVLLGSEQADLERCAEVTGSGSVEICGDLTPPWTRVGLELLARKMPGLGVMLDVGSLGSYQLMRLKMESVVHRTYLEVLSNTPKTILRFAP